MGSMTPGGKLMRRLIRFLLVMVILALPAPGIAQSDKDPLAREEYAVYSAVISKNYINYIKKTVRLVVVTTPTCCEVTDEMKDRVPLYFGQFPPPAPRPSQETLDNYAERNRKTFVLHKSFKLPVKYRIVPYKRIERLFDMIELEEDWKAFYRMFPQSNGYMTLSRVGFNRAMDEALVSRGWMCGSLCGEGRYVLLRKKDGRWRVETDVMIWAS
jgi:hypothetical protein